MGGRGEKKRTEGDVCVFMLQQCEPQLCDPLTLGETLSVVEDDQLKEEAHNDTQLHAGTVCACVSISFPCIIDRLQ